MKCQDQVVEGHVGWETLLRLTCNQQQEVSSQKLFAVYIFYLYTLQLYMDDLIIYLAYTIFTVLYGNITKDNRNIMQPLCACLWRGNKNPDVNRVL